MSIIEKITFCRAFEEEVAEAHKAGHIKIPIYLSLGQEIIPAVISEYIKPEAIFAQHRAHSTYICFGGNVEALIMELLSLPSSPMKGMCGSASIHDPNIKMFGHSGLMGDQVPIGVGYCLATKKLTYISMGDASCEEDYVLGALGYAATKSLPVIFVVEDNNLSILTEKKVRKSWSISRVASAFGIESHDINDNIYSIASIVRSWDKKSPILLNINTTRSLWHAGSGIDKGTPLDTYTKYLKLSSFDLYNQQKIKVKELWKQYLK